MDAVFYLASAFFFTWIVRNILFWISLWQLKEYRFDRVLIHLKDTAQGKNLLISPLSIAKWFAFFAYSIIVFRDNLTDFYQIFVAIIFCFQAVLVVKELASKSIKIPVFTAKAIFIIIATVFITIVFYILPIVDKFLWLIILDRLVVFLIAFFIFSLSFPTGLYRDWKIEKAAQKIKSFKNILVIGITGSYGKSTTKDFTAQILGKKFNTLKTKENNNTPIGIANTILSGLNKNTEIFVVEMGAYKKGEILEMCKIVNPKMGILTSVNEQHLSLFGSFENIMKAKYELIEFLPRNGLSLFNGNNANSFSLYKKTIQIRSQQAKNKVVLYKHLPDSKLEEIGKTTNTIVAFNTVVKKNSVGFDVSLKSKIIHFTAPFIGSHSIENVLPGIYIANSLGMGEEDIRKAVSVLKPVVKTMIFHESKDSFSFVDDTYNANPESVKAAVDYMKIYKGKKFLVLQPIIELGKSAKDEHYRIAKQISNICNYLILTNKNYSDSIMKGIKDGRGKCVAEILETSEAFEFIEANAERGDVVVFEGKEAGFVVEKLLKRGG